MNKTAKWIILVFMWFAILGTASLVHKFWWKPKKIEQAQQQAVVEKQEMIQKTSSQARYQHTVRFALDAFSGYAPIRSTNFQNECAKFGILMEFHDDAANYKERMKALTDGRIDMAVFTIDALIKTLPAGDYPAKIVAVVDESKGADAIVAAGKVFPNLDTVNSPDVKFVCVPDSPSETLARVVMSHFNLDSLNQNPFEFLPDANAVYKAYQNAKPEDRKVFVTWEPYISKIIENPDYHVILDTSKVRGYVVDVIIARLDFLAKHEDLVEKVVKSYLTTVFSYRNDMITLVMEDAKTIGDPLKQEQAKRLCETIWWKNTQENFGHFGLVKDTNILHLYDICRGTTGILSQTHAIGKDPTDNQFNLLYYDGLMRKLHEQSWHPGYGEESIRQEKSLLTLNENEWKTLKPVGTLQVPRLVFARGTSRLTEASELILSDLSEKLKAFPQYYLLVRGNASSTGDLEANLKLATERAQAATDWLVQHGVNENRIRAESAKPNGSTTVMFVLGELPY